MKNRGYITVFVALVIVVSLVLVTAVIKITDQGYARTKVTSAVSSAMSGELAKYNRYIFDRYHILLVDKKYDESGEDSIQKGIKESLEYDLGEDFEIGEIKLSGDVGILEDDCFEFQKQLGEIFKYDIAEYSVDKIMDKTNGNDEPVDDSTVSSIDGDIAATQGEISNSENTEGEDSGDAEPESENGSEEEVEDPRETLKKFTDAGIAALIMPPDVKVSSYTVSSSDLPSSGMSSFFSSDVDTDFKDKDTLETDSMKGNGWGTNLLGEAKSIMYASKYFNCLTDKKFDDTELNFEMEYMIAGNKSDGENYKKVVDEILLIRFGFNFAYILTDTVKMAECDSIALALTAEFPPLQPVVKYLLAGCWAYIESVADVYRLLRHHKVPYMKDQTTWLTDFESLAKLDQLTGPAGDDETGLDYKEYLMILMALQGKKINYRMLDLIEINTNKNDSKNFKMKNAITAFGIDAEITYKGKEFPVHEEAGY